MTSYHFQPRFAQITRIPATFSIAQLEREVGVYSATPTFVRERCGEIAQMFLDQVPETYYAEADRLELYPNCDVRIHRLYPGDYPAYPGWHCDGEYRETYFSQPDLNHIKVSHHLTGHVSTVPGGVSCTQFLTQPLTIHLTKKPDSEHTLWGQVHQEVQRLRGPTISIEDGQLVQFDSWTLHRATPARVRGWRLFFRMAMWHRPNLGQGGMITRQEQVYKTVEGTGW